MLSIAFPHIFDYVRNLTIQDEAQVIQRLRGDGHAALHPIDRVCGHALPIDQFVCGDIALVQRFPKGTVGDHADNLSAFFLPYHA